MIVSRVVLRFLSLFWIIRFTIDGGLKMFVGLEWLKCLL